MILSVSHYSICYSATQETIKLATYSNADWVDLNNSKSTSRVLTIVNRIVLS
jgi:hypothetical protein